MFVGSIKVILLKRTNIKLMENIKKRLEHLREQVKNENISLGEIAELQGLSEHINKNDVLLLEWAGVKEN